MRSTQPQQQSPGSSGCDGFRRMQRREALAVGVCGALGFSLADLLRLEARAAEPATQAFTQQRGANKPPAKALSVIHLNLGGGFPHHESFDPKPESPVEYRGPFGVLKTRTGEIMSDQFPKTAAVADKINIVRSVVGRIPDHALAT